MRIISAFAGAALVVGVATAVAAQTPPAQPNPNTKVYAYQQTAPKAKSHIAKHPKSIELLPSSVPHGSPKWWEINARSNSGGGDGGSP